MLRMHSKSGWTLLLCAAFVLLLAQFQFTNWMEAHNDSLQALNEATDGVLNGTPHWRAYQNRVLSPAIVYVLGWFTWHPMTMFVQVAIIVLDAALFFLVLHKTGKPVLAALALMGATLLWVLEQHYWSYTWDFSEAAGWLALAWLALGRGTLRSVLSVVAISAFNRESAMFMALFPIIAGLWMMKSGQPQGRQWVLGGCVALVLTMVLVEVLRKVLFEHSALSGVGGDLSHAVFENHINLDSNLTFFKKMLEQASPLVFILGLYLVSFLMIIWTAFERDDALMLGVGLSLAACFMSLLVFGILNETRLYQPFNWCLMYLLVGCLAPVQPKICVDEAPVGAE